ncbi:hypothetical protein BATDEDRAFT_28457 [Batrachochytrium dendrobatidis JAM81]|uniref:Uncharacterized protein n=1 Tax=Batrachochytrium dendrobatidis (strain JAM81 / FGSC 10211) TaxID=684364 RepID=F4PE72_BATDJ|nr:uncharacterized protein BATDEDRAFT_28457 [Batrachochytrium dendrobatidis JAM81]EGF76508.1 hypothetical protein BATDEDRAFT_28457 [Batrachochytrium dendrobatidis JAM81]KAK5672606.1 hypothetical protein QVD99_000125 [Batrachochytrium dendrobatidis]|eukprot:XP_006682819.1 hypothetical protein BATDEDRAFT_28457 [Batrachochytrium dendrobatidis JAM81]
MFLTVIYTLRIPALLAIGINGIMGAIAIYLQTELFYDATGTATFILCTLLSLWNAIPFPATFLQGMFEMDLRRLLLFVAVLVWAIRLGVFLFYRVHALGGDRRFDTIKMQPFRFAIVWLMQAIWTILVPLPIYTVLSIPTSLQTYPLGILDGMGLSLFMIGFAIEGVADMQKLQWQIELGEKRFSQVNTRGLWNYSRYPNYFGEILVWIGIYICAVNALDWTRLDGIAMAIMMSISPLFISVLLLKVSGIPLQEKMAIKRYAGNQEYQEYVDRTSMIIPWIPKTLPKKVD